MRQEHDDDTIRARALVMLGPLQRTVVKVSRDLGVPYDTVWRWRRELRSGRLQIPQDQIDAALGLSRPVRRSRR